MLTRILSHSKLVFCLVFLTVAYTGAYAQFASEIPLDFDQVEPALHLRNPGYVNNDASFTGNLGYQGFNSLSKNIKTFYANALFTLADTTSRSHHIGLQSYTDQEGVFIQHNRIYARYAYQLALNQKVDLSLGLAAGVINFSVKENPALGTFNKTKFDVKVGGQISGSKASFNVSVLQFLDQKVTFETGELTLKRYYQGFGNYVMDLGPTIRFEPAIFVRYASGYRTDFRVIGTLIIHDQAYVSLTGGFPSSMVLGAGLREIDLLQLKFQLGLSYRLWFENDSQRQVNLMEFTLAIKKQEKSKQGYILDANLLNNQL